MKYYKTNSPAISCSKDEPLLSDIPIFWTSPQFAGNATLRQSSSFGKVSAGSNAVIDSIVEEARRLSDSFILVTQPFNNANRSITEGLCDRRPDFVTTWHLKDNLPPFENVNSDSV